MNYLRKNEKKKKKKAHRNYHTMNFHTIIQWMTAAEVDSPETANCTSVHKHVIKWGYRLLTLTRAFCITDVHFHAYKYIHWTKCMNWFVIMKCIHLAVFLITTYTQGFVSVRYFLICSEHSKQIFRGFVCLFIYLFIQIVLFDPFLQVLRLL